MTKERREALRRFLKAFVLAPDWPIALSKGDDGEPLDCITPTELRALLDSDERLERLHAWAEETRDDSDYRDEQVMGENVLQALRDIRDDMNRSRTATPTAQEGED